jgi:hypothetical protein
LLRGETNSFGWLFTNTKTNIFIYSRNNFFNGVAYWNKLIFCLINKPEN